MNFSPKYARSLFYGTSGGIILGLLVHLIWRAAELSEFEWRLRNAGVPSRWFDSPKTRAGLIDSNLFNVFRTGPTWDLLFWPLAGGTIGLWRYRRSPRRPGLPLIFWTIGVAAFGLFAIADTNASFRTIMDRELQRQLKAVADWEGDRERKERESQNSGSPDP